MPQQGPFNNQQFVLRRILEKPAHFAAMSNRQNEEAGSECRPSLTNRNNTSNRNI
jgi:hypothetical protein